MIKYIYDENGNIVTTYTYDAWGRQVSVTGSNVTLGNLNPIRYKSYFYDSDTGFYYLETRFYDPTVGRFISPDNPAYLGASGSVLGWNLYSYCENNPVLGSDANGHMAAAIVVSDYVLAQFISWLTVIASSNCWNVVGWVVAAVIAAGAITYGAVTLYNKWKTKEASKTKTLKNTINAIIPKKEKPYYFAYIDQKGCLVKSGKGMSFVEALTCLGVKKAAETLKSNYKVKINNPFGSNDWGIYAKNQAYAKALAVALGNKKPPEIHESGYYGHYHDGKHKIHIWFGTCIYY